MDGGGSGKVAQFKYCLNIKYVDCAWDLRAHHLTGWSLCVHKINKYTIFGMVKCDGTVWLSMGFFYCVLSRLSRTSMAIVDVMHCSVYYFTR